MNRRCIREKFIDIGEEAAQRIRDANAMNRNRPDLPPHDCEVERVVLALARTATLQLDSGDVRAFETTSERLYGLR